MLYVPTKKKFLHNSTCINIVIKLKKYIDTVNPIVPLSRNMVKSTSSCFFVFKSLFASVLLCRVDGVVHRSVM